MTFCLDTIILKPEKGLKIENAIILLHGYGGDGQDISMLSYGWRRHLPNTIFICPNGHEKCAINPTGYQWFDLSKDDPEYILNESKKAETKLNKFLNEIKNEFKFLYRIFIIDEFFCIFCCKLYKHGEQQQNK